MIEGVRVDLIKWDGGEWTRSSNVRWKQPTYKECQMTKTCKQTVSDDNKLSQLMWGNACLSTQSTWTATTRVWDKIINFTSNSNKTKSNTFANLLPEDHVIALFTFRIQNLHALSKAIIIHIAFLLGTFSSLH